MILLHYFGSWTLYFPEECDSIELFVFFIFGSFFSVDLHDPEVAFFLGGIKEPSLYVVFDNGLILLVDFWQKNFNEVFFAKNRSKISLGEHFLHPNNYIQVILKGLH